MKKINEDNRGLFEIADRISEISRDLLEEFNAKKNKLFDLPTHKRIFLFFFTKSLKTHAAVYKLCRQGFGQDVANLLRGLLDNLISIEYILHDSDLADKKTVRFVEYKWVIFRRYLGAKKGKVAGDPLTEKEQLILKKCEDYKEKYEITSDRGLLTWSGMSVKDMAKRVSTELLEEYESTFRFCSRFLHPGIVGDDEYLNYKGDKMIFSPIPSHVGVGQALVRDIEYIMEFIELFNDLFDLGRGEEIKQINKRLLKTEDFQKTGNDPAIERAVAAPGKGFSDKIVLQFDLDREEIS